MWRIKNNQRGDTIMEVLIAIAVLSFVLGLSYNLANRSSQANRQSAERSEAFKYTESQIEKLKSYLSKSATPSLPTSGAFCMKNDSTPSAQITVVATDRNSENFSGFTDPAFAECKKGDYYYSYIVRSGIGNTFTAYTRWYNAAGTGVDEATMVHKIYPDLASKELSFATGIDPCDPNEGLTAIKGCLICPDGFSSPRGYTAWKDCSAIPPKAVVTVNKIKPSRNPPYGGGVDPTPPCSSTDYQNIAGVKTTLTRTGDSKQENTLADSKAYFSNLGPFAPLLYQSAAYTATVFAPAKHEICGSATATVPSMGLGPVAGQGAENTDTKFTIRPVCYQKWVDVTGVYPHYSAPYNVYGWIPQGHTIYWPSHPGTNGTYSDGRRSTPLPALGGKYYWKKSDTVTPVTNANGQFYWEVWLADGHSGWQVDPPVWGITEANKVDFLGNYADQAQHWFCD